VDRARIRHLEGAIVKAAPEAQRRLLDLQAVDTALAQLAHRRRSLPELAEIETVAREISALEDERVRAQVAVDDLDRDIARFEKDIDQVRTRKTRDQSRLDAGGSLREIEGLQHELATLNLRQSELEDAELELMEQRETAEEALNAVKARLAEAGQRRDAAEGRRDAAYAEIAKEQEFRTAARAPLAADLPADLVTLYDKIRTETGMGAALVRAGRCGGCRIELYGADLARVKNAPADEVVRCEECRRIMVRTPESGL
jgi:predicted  nucleic acid-binding Zn-ribbon protein